MSYIGSGDLEISSTFYQEFVSKTSLIGYYKIGESLYVGESRIGVHCNAVTDVQTRMNG